MTDRWLHLVTDPDSLRAPVLLILDRTTAPELVREAAELAWSARSPLAVLIVLDGVAIDDDEPAFDDEVACQLRRTWEVVDATTDARVRLVRALGSRGAEVLLVVRFGSLAAVAARIAEERSARLVVMPGGRPRGLETAAEIALRSRTLVLYAASERTLPLRSAPRLRLRGQLSSAMLLRGVLSAGRPGRRPRQVFLVPDRRRRTPAGRLLS